MSTKIYPIVFPFLFICVFIPSVHAQWTDISIPSTWPLERAAFTDGNTGYIIVQNQTKLFRTTNGGSTWDSITLTGGITHDVEFISSTAGFILTDSSSVFSISTTTDGGNTWSKDTLPADYYQMIRYTDANNGFAANNFGSVYHTTDAGNSWTQLPMGGYSSPFDKEYTGPDTIIFSGWDGSFAYQGSIIRRDGAGVFQELIMPKNYSQFQGTFFLNGMEGYAVFNVMWPSYKNYLTHTTDGGSTWDTILTDTTSTIAYNDVWMNGSGEGYIVASSGLSDGIIFRVSGNTTTVDLNAPAYLRRIYAGGNMLFAVGNDGSVYKTTQFMSVENQVQELKGIYPNPTSDLLNIPINEASEVSIININGQVMINHVIYPGNMLSLQELAPGIYTVFVINSKGRSAAQVVVR